MSDYQVNDYPEENCPIHPERLWKWDGFGWICVNCILERSMISMIAQNLARHAGHDEHPM